MFADHDVVWRLVRIEPKPRERSMADFPDSLADLVDAVRDISMALPHA